MFKALLLFFIATNSFAAVKLQDLKYSCQVDLLGQADEVRERIVLQVSQQECKKNDSNKLVCAYSKRVKGFKDKALEIGIVISAESSLLAESQSYTYLKYNNDITVKAPLAQPSDEVEGISIYNEIRPAATAINLKDEKIQFVKCDLVADSN